MFIVVIVGIIHIASLNHGGSISQSSIGPRSSMRAEFIDSNSALSLHGIENRDDDVEVELRRKFSVPETRAVFMNRLLHFLGQSQPTFRNPQMNNLDVDLFFLYYEVQKFGGYEKVRSS